MGRDNHRHSNALRDEAWSVIFEAAAARDQLRMVETRLEILIDRGRDNPHFGGLEAEDLYLALKGATKAVEDLRPLTVVVERRQSEFRTLEQEDEDDHPVGRRVSREVRTSCLTA